MISAIASIVTVLAGVYLLTLAAVAVVRPLQAKRYLEGHASTARLHYIELAIRVVVGVSLVAAAPDMWSSAAFLAFGWILVGSTIVLCCIPWRVHRQFAQWAVPLATRRLPWLAVGSLLGGAAVIAARVIGPVPR